jgi:mannose-6-phosphate isomerase-like protein (cupin superfamily)
METRPWGRFYVLLNLYFIKVKILIMNPQQRFSLQKHFHRSELWVLFEKSFIVQKWHRAWITGFIFWIKKGSVHRLSNTGTKPLRILEIQFGKCDESDIERIEDDYDRYDGDKLCE